jgi:hypothetical protein
MQLALQGNAYIQRVHEKTSEPPEFGRAMAHRPGRHPR